MLVSGYVKCREGAPKMEIKEVYCPSACTEHQQDGWDLLAVLPGKNPLTGMPYVIYIMARAVR